MSMPTPPPVTSWQVTGQKETTEIASDGSPVRGITVYYTTGANQSGSVFIPRAQYSVDYVRAAVGQAAALADQVGSLSSGA